MADKIQCFREDEAAMILGVIKIIPKIKRNKNISLIWLIDYPRFPTIFVRYQQRA